MRWYFAPPGAKPLPQGSVWASTIWLDARELCDTAVGEQPRTRRDPWGPGTPPLGARGVKPCGTFDDFHAQKVWDPHAPLLPRGPGGLPLCCNPVLGNAIAWCGRKLQSSNLELSTSTLVSKIDGLLLPGETLEVAMLRLAGVNWPTPAISCVSFGGSLTEQSLELGTGDGSSLELNTQLPGDGSTVLGGATSGAQESLALARPDFPVGDLVVTTVEGTGMELTAQMPGDGATVFGGPLPAGDGSAVLGDIAGASAGALPLDMSAIAEGSIDGASVIEEISVESLDVGSGDETGYCGLVVRGDGIPVAPDPPTQTCNNYDIELGTLYLISVPASSVVILWINSALPAGPHTYTFTGTGLNPFTQYVTFVQGVCPGGFIIGSADTDGATTFATFGGGAINGILVYLTNTDATLTKLFTVEIDP